MKLSSQPVATLKHMNCDIFFRINIMQWWYNDMLMLFSYLYKRLCLSIHPSIGLSVRQAFLTNRKFKWIHENSNKFNLRPVVAKRRQFSLSSSQSSELLEPMRGQILYHLSTIKQISSKILKLVGTSYYNKLSGLFWTIW